MTAASVPRVRLVWLDLVALAGPVTVASREELVSGASGKSGSSVRRRLLKLAFASFALLFAIGVTDAGAVGFQWITVADPEDQPLDVAVWYPSDSPVAPQALGPYRQTVAADGAISGSQLPLVVISHGTGGGAGSHFDTALALAEAGFVVAAITHTGDNFKDRHDSFRARSLISRPRHVVRTVDHMLTIWPAHGSLDPTRIGIFGHSAGAFTALVAVGGTPNLDRIAQRCRERPEDQVCQPTPEHGETNDRAQTGAPVFMHDPRIGAAVIAATGLGMTFEDGGLSAVRVPIQMWRAAEDRIAVDQWSTAIIRRELPTPPDEHVVALAGHYAFLPPCSDALAAAAPEVCVDAPGFDRAEFHRTFNETLIAFFRARLPASKPVR
jgi:predicted dienelactone hydrolase